MGKRGPMSADEMALLDAGDDEFEEHSHIQPYVDMPLEQQQLWMELISDFPPGIHNNCDRPLMRTYIETVFTYQRLVEESEGEPGVIANEAGNPIINPIHRILDQYRKTVASIAVKLRMAPSGRQNSYYETKRDQGMASQPKKKRPGGRPQLAN